jgi:hypothetical protein
VGEGGFGTTDFVCSPRQHTFEDGPLALICLAHCSNRRSGRRVTMLSAPYARLVVLAARSTSQTRRWAIRFPVSLGLAVRLLPFEEQLCRWLTLAVVEFGFVFVHQPSGDIDQFHVRFLGGAGEGGEGLEPGEVVAVHQYAFGLADDVAGGEG